MEDILKYFEIELMILIIMTCSVIFYLIKDSKLEETMLSYRLKHIVTFVISAFIGVIYYYFGAEIAWVKWLNSFGLATSLYDIIIKELLKFIKSKFTGNGNTGIDIPKS